MIRPTTPADTDELVAIADETGQFKPLEIAGLREALGDYHATNQADNHHAIVVEENRKIVGFAYYGPVAMTEGTWQLYWIVVRKDRQHRGIGTRLLQYAEKDIHANHHGRVLFIETGSPPHYEGARQFYRKNGCEQHALLQDFYADGDSMVVFRKAL